MEIALGGEFTEQDVRHAIALGYPRSFRILRVALPLGLLLPVLFTLEAAIKTVTSENAQLEPVFLLLNFLPALFSLLLFAFFAYTLWLLPLRQARQVCESPLCQGTFRGLVTDETLTLSNAASESAVRWDAFVHYKMSEDVVLLYQNRAASNMVPRSLFATDQDWHRFQQHVQDTVPKEPPKTPSVWRWILYVALALIVIMAILGALYGPPQ